LEIENAAGASYPAGWEGYRAVASYDGTSWFRVPTEFEAGTLSVLHRPSCDAVYYSYFAPYSTARHQEFVARAQAQPGVRLEVLGQTLDGRDLDLLVISEALATGASAAANATKKRCWIWARQHPGETMAEWLAEGLVEALLDRDDPIARALLRRADLYVLPNMNPDGSARGHLRCNAVGANLNREWTEPTLERSPEVYRVREAMQATGVDFGLDVHGDEALPHNFISGVEGIPSLSAKQRDLQADYSRALLAASPDFQVEHGYPITPPGRANLTMGANWVAERFGCLAMTLEMPFKDTEGHEHPDGWSPERARAFGRAQLVALLAIVDRL
jgi:murein tripeptide amidase MpaA